MKILKINIAVICVIAFLLCVFAMPVGAESLQKELIYLDSKCNIAVNVSYVDNGSGKEPEISFVSPSGTKYSEALSNLTAEHFPQEKIICYYIQDAASGSWDIVYDSSFSGKLTVDIVKYARDIMIKSFEIKSVNSNYASTGFYVEFPVSVRYNYKISAVTLNENGFVEGRKELYSGYAYSNSSNTANVYLSELASYSKYYLMLEVFAEDYDIEVKDQLISANSFSYENLGAYDPIEGFSVVFNCDTGEMTVDWENATGGWYANQYNVVVEAEGKTVFANSYESSYRSAEFVINPNVANIKVSMSYERYGEYSKVSSLSFSPASDGVNILTEEQTSSSQAEISYFVKEDCSATVYVNDNSGEKVFLSGGGTFSVNIDSGYNTVKVTQELSDYVSLLTEKKIYSDRIAPSLNFFENLSSLTVEDSSFTLIGQTEPGSVFTVNGKGYTLDPDGTFSVDLNLISGENAFEIVSSDSVGNRSVRRIKIMCSSTPGSVSQNDENAGTAVTKWIPLVVSFVLAAIIAVVFIILGKKKKLNFVAVSLMIMIICIVIAAVAVIMFVLQKSEVVKLDELVNGKGFFDLVKESPKKAYEHMEQLDEAEEALARMQTVMIVVLSVAGASLLLFVFALILRKLKKSKLKKEQNSEKDPLVEKTPSKKEKDLKEIDESDLTEEDSGN